MEGTNLPKPTSEPTKDQISTGHIRRSKPARQKRASYWKALESGWRRTTKKEYDNYQAEKNRKKQQQKQKQKQGKSRQKAKSSRKASEKSLDLSFIKSAHNKPTLTLPWIKHDNFSKFKNHFKQVGNELIEHQGWYCLGTSELLSYVGMVGNWNKKDDEMANYTIWLRWTDDSLFKGHDVVGIKWPKGLFQNDKLKIDGAMAKVHTCTIASVKPNPKMKSKNPPIYNRNWSQHKLITMVEDALIFLPASEYRIEPGRLYQKNKNDSFISENSGGKPIVIKNKKAMINAKSFDTFPSTRWYLGGDFNIKCSGDMPSQLSSIFGNGIHVKSVIDNLQPTKLKDGPKKKK